MMAADQALDALEQKPAGDDAGDKGAVAEAVVQGGLVRPVGALATGGGGGKKGRKGGGIVGPKEGVLLRGRGSGGWWWWRGGGGV